MNSKESDLLIEEDPWLASILGIRSEKIQIQSIDKYMKYRLENRAEYPFFTTIKVDGPFYRSPNKPLDGLRFIQEMHLYTWHGSANQKRTTANIRKYRHEDQSAILLITENAFNYSRFHADSRFSHELAEKIKREWILHNLTSRPNTHNLVAEVNNDVVGYCSLLISSDRISIDLIAVKASVRGKGVGGSLIGQSQQYASLNKKELFVGTQKHNPANSLYLRFGFINRAIHTVWHHFNREMS